MEQKPWYFKHIYLSTVALYCHLLVLKLITNLSRRTPDFLYCNHNVYQFTHNTPQLLYIVHICRLFIFCIVLHKSCVYICILYCVHSALCVYWYLYFVCCIFICILYIFDQLFMHVMPCKCTVWRKRLSPITTLFVF